MGGPPGFLPAAVAASTLLGYGAVGAPARELSLRLVDDRGAAVGAPVEACFQIGTRNECVTSPRGAAILAPADFLSVRVEGPSHGPARVNRRDLKVGEDGSSVVAVPRKADLEVQTSAAAQAAVTLSLYAVDDASFRVPAWREVLPPKGSLRIPAGSYVASLSVAGHAPDLHLLSAPPGSRRRLTLQARQGWSLVLRCVAAKDRRVVAGAVARLEGEEGFAVGAPLRETVEASGLALFSGIEHSLAVAAVEHADFVGQRATGLSASPGTFAFREVELEEGATLRAEVAVAGKPAEGVVVRVLEYEPTPLGPVPEPVAHAVGRTDASGVFRSGKIPPGSYTLRLTPPGNPSHFDKSVELTAGSETTVSVELLPIRVTGRVSQGGKPAPSFVVTFNDQDEIKPNATRRDAQTEAVTDEDGAYEVTLWSPADYSVLLYAPDNTPAAGRRVRLEGSEEHVDFFLEEQSIRGVVVTERNEPVEEASVLLSWNLRTHRRGLTDQHGSFNFPVAEPGTGTLKIMKPGYVTPEPVEVAVQEGIPLPPLVVKLKKSGQLSGRLLTGRGEAAGARLQSYRVEPNGGATWLSAATADVEGRFELVAADAGPTRLFATGAGCPLSVFELGGPGDGLQLRCAEVPATLELTLEGSDGLRLAGRSVLVRREGVFIPQPILIEHLGRFRRSAATDGKGRLGLVGLAPGRYELYLADVTSPELVSYGAQTGLLAAVTLSPLTTLEVAVTVESP